MIEDFYTTTISYSRMTWSGDSSALVSQGSFLGHIQQAGADYVEHIGEALGKVYLIWCDESETVTEGDTITIASGDYAGTYNVKAIQTNAIGNNKHLELALIKD